MILTRSYLASRAAERWRSTYWDADRHLWRHGDDKRLISERLAALGPAPSVEQVNQAIGNESWTQLRCHHCNLYKDAVWIVDDSEYPIYVCQECLIAGRQEFALATK